MNIAELHRFLLNHGKYKEVYVLAVYEIDEGAAIPQNKNQLMDLATKNLARQYHLVRNSINSDGMDNLQIISTQMLLLFLL